MSSKGGKGGTSNGGGGREGPSLTIARRMSAPGVKIDKGMTRVSGTGLALAGCSIEQDAAYWEWHVERLEGPSSDDDPEELFDEESAPKFGVATRKDRKFFQTLEAGENDDDATPAEDGTALMRAIPVANGDTIGVAIQQSDLPMVQFLVNGEPMHDIAINRFRGSVFPSIYIREGVMAEAVFDEDNFKEMSPHARFGPLIAARGII